jgi:heterodisulfide reductase subunit B
LRYAYYPGCSLEGTAKEYDLSVRAVCQQLGIELEEIPNWNCCGASSGHSTDYWLSLALPGRNLALAEKEGLDIAVACPACFLRLKNTRHEVKDDRELQRRLSELIGLPYAAKYEVKHLLNIITHEIEVEAIKEKVVKPLTGLKVVAYYGCYLVRPPKVTLFDDAEDPQSMDILLRALGAEVLDWSGKVDCCGGSLGLSKRDIVVQLVKEIAETARSAEAEAIVTACPLCQSNLDARQGSRGLPVLYFTELMGLAMGIPQAKAWLRRHLISPLKLLHSYGLM